MSKLRVALIQMLSCGTDQEANLKKGDEFCRCARNMDADIALFPEMWNIGYSFYDRTKPDARREWESRAISQNDNFFIHFRKLAKELDMAIALTYLERWKGSPRNSVSMIDRKGDVLMTYAKVHTCDFDLESSLTPGDDFYVCDLEAKSCNVKIGAMICYDREFPESARILMLKGAEIILTPNACGLEINRLTQFRTRAYENMVGVVMANYPAPMINGHSVAYDGIAFDENENSRDMLIIEAGEHEGIFMAEFDIDALRKYRSHEAWGNSFRKPSRYDLLVSKQVNPPFVRETARR